MGFSDDFSVSVACRTGGIFSYSRQIEAKAGRARSASRARGEER